ncbi:MAG: 16S rRNA (uracil(1498)-N(3))-methyltransferase [Bacteroidota bacterium]
MEYFYTPPALVTPPTLAIEGDELNHLTHVMRMRVGDAICVVDGAGTAYDAVIREITRRSALCTISDRHPGMHEAACAVTLAAGMLKNPARFDYLVEKSVELGVRTIVPLLTERTIARQAKTDRWQKLCIAAMKQSGRCFLPQIQAAVPYPQFIASEHHPPLRFIAHESARHPLRGMPTEGEAHALICIGPEGGFSTDELRMAERGGFRLVSLGRRRLRTETAAVVAVAALLQG